MQVTRPDPIGLDKCLEPAGGIAVSLDFHSIHGFLSYRTGRLGANNADLEVVGKAAAEFVDETGFGVAPPSRIGGGQDQKARFGVCEVRI